MQPIEIDGLPQGRACVYSLLMTVVDPHEVGGDIEQRLFAALSAPAEAKVAVAVGDEIVRFRHAANAGAALLIELPLGPVPQENAAACTSRLLKLNFIAAHHRLCAFSIDSEDGEIVYTQPVAVDRSELSDFIALVRSLAELAPQWRLAIFGPAKFVPPSFSRPGESNGIRHR